MRIRTTSIIPITLVCCLGGSVHRSARAQCIDGWQAGSGKPGASRTFGFAYIEASLRWDPDGDGPLPARFVIGGEFDYIDGFAAKNLAYWNGREWKKFGIGPNQPVRALAIYQDELVVAGEFTSIDGVACNRIARWNGSAWLPLGSGTNGPIFALENYNGELVAAGPFTQIGGLVTVGGIGRWNGTSWQRLANGTLGTSNVALTVYQGELIVGGNFESASGTPAKYVARWNGTSWRPLGSGVSWWVLDLCSYNGKLIAGGAFGTAGGVSAKGVAAWDGSQWSPLTDGVSTPSDGNRVYALGEYRGDLYVGGELAIAGSVTSGSLAVWNGTSWRAVGGSSSVVGSTQPVRSLLEYRDELIVCGSFGITIGPTAELLQSNGLARWNGTEWQIFSTWISGLNNWLEYYGPSVLAIAHHGNDLVVGGDFPMAGGRAAQSLARWNGSNWQAFSEPLDDPYALILRMREFRGELVVAGVFDHGPQSVANSVARWNGTHWQSLGLGLSYQGYLANGYALGEFNGDLIVGGAFDHAGGVPANNIARWDGVQWHTLGSGLDAPPLAFAVFNGELIAGGVFATAGGLPASCAAAWNGTQWRALGAGVTRPGIYSPNITALEVFDGNLIAGGYFSTAGASEARSVARWDGVQWSPLGSGVEGGHGGVSSLKSYHGKLFVGGSFDRAGGILSRRIASWNGSQWSGLGGVDTSWSEDVYVYALGEHDGDLIVGGYFGDIGGRPGASWARWGPVIRPADIISQPKGRSTRIGQSATFQLQAESEWPISYQWRHNGIELIESDRFVGVNTRTLTVHSVTHADAGNYDCVVSTACTATTSVAAPLIVYSVAIAPVEADVSAEP